MKKKEIRKKVYGKEGLGQNVRKKESECRKKRKEKSMVKGAVLL